MQVRQQVNELHRDAKMIAAMWLTALVGVLVLVLSVASIYAGWVEGLWWLVVLGGIVFGAYVAAMFLILAIVFSE